MKRAFDVFLSIILGGILLIPASIIAVLIKLTSKGPILFWSKRVGSDGNAFMMPKFRSMKVDAPIVASDLFKSPEKYITKIGTLLRKSSLDELPQIYSVLVGTMSFVGPRPALESQIELLKMRSMYGIDLLRPGITGWAQVHGRDELSNDEKIFMELEYLKRQSISFDFYILWLTLIVIIKRDGISH